jgi:methionyl-tRNA formyltransferase/MoaA/NifB/PqqE/SkfB family radical SAM enzyme
MKTIVFAASGFGNVILEELMAAGHDVGAVFTQSADEEFVAKLGIPSLLSHAASRNIPSVSDVDPLRDAAAARLLDQVSPELVVVVGGYHRTVSTHVFKTAREAVYIHPSLLPAYRGPSALHWVLIQGETETGVTIAKLARRNDAGEILLQRRVTICADDDVASLYGKLTDVMRSLWRSYEERRRQNVLLVPHPQDLVASTMYPKVTSRDGHIRFDQSHRKIVQRFRGTTPYPGAYTDIDGRNYRILALRVLSDGAFLAEVPGMITGVDPTRGEVVVSALEGGIVLQLDISPSDLHELASRSGNRSFAGRHTPFAVKESTSGALYDRAWPDPEEFTRYTEFPDMVVLAVAYPCNAYCPNCPYTPENSAIREKYGDAAFMAPELFRKIADECGEAGKQGWLSHGKGAMLRITGGGEPMLHPAGMTNLIEYAKGKGARIYLNSNGSLFTHEDIDRLLACETDNIEISVDAADEETYAIVRKGLDWRRLLETIRYMIDRRNMTKSSTTIEVSVINQEKVSGKIPEIERFWYEFGVDNVIVRKFLTWGSSTNIDPGKSADPLAYLDRDAGVPCPYPFHRLNIDSRGKVEVCGFDIMGRTNMGDVRKQTIREIWKGSLFEWWRMKHRCGQGGDIPLCAECPDWQYRSWEHNYRKALAAAQERRDRAVGSAT